MSDEPEKKSEDDDAWIDKVSNALGHLGFNKTRIRWKLIRWKEERRRAARRREQQVQHITYAHKTCAECGAVQDKDATVCSACNAKLGKRGWQVLGRLGILSPVGLSMSTVLALALLAVYAREWILAGGGLKAPTGYLLVDLGGRWPPLMDDEPWRHLTAVFLHAGIWHIAFNVLAIAQIGPRIEELYGRWTMLGLFVLTGVLANIGALQVGKIAVGIGASGGLCGLIGIAAGYGQRLGTGRGRAIRNDMLKWMAYTFIFGFAVGADNWAHLFGLLGGLAFGFALKPETWARKLVMPLRILLGLAGAAGTIAAVILVFTRHPTAHDEEGYQENAQRAAMSEWTNNLGKVCTPYYEGDTKAALAELKRMYSRLDGDVPDEALTLAAVEETCESIQTMRVACARDRSKLPIESKRSFDDTCDMYKPMFEVVPVRTPKEPVPDFLPEPPPAGSGSAAGSAK